VVRNEVVLTDNFVSWVVIHEAVLDLTTFEKLSNLATVKVVVGLESNLTGLSDLSGLISNGGCYHYLVHYYCFLDAVYWQLPSEDTCNICPTLRLYGALIPFHCATSATVWP
jgi:hypothetical protein